MESSRKRETGQVSNQKMTIPIAHDSLFVMKYNKRNKIIYNRPNSKNQSINKTICHSQSTENMFLLIISVIHAAVACQLSINIVYNITRQSVRATGQR